MPRPTRAVPYHRIHVNLDEDDYLWLKSRLRMEEGLNGQVSEFFRQVVKKLRNGTVPGSRQSALDAIGGLEL